MTMLAQGFIPQGSIVEGKTTCRDDGAVNRNRL